MRAFWSNIHRKLKMENKPKIAKVGQIIRLNKYHVILILTLLILGIVQFAQITFDAIKMLVNWIIGS